MLTLHLNNELEQQFNTFSRQSGQSCEQTLKDLVVDYLEDCQDILQAEQIIKAIDNGSEQVFTLDEAKKKLYELAS